MEGDEVDYNSIGETDSSVTDYVIMGPMTK